MGESGPSSCHFENITVEPRQEIPARFDQQVGFALVRRGLVIRQRPDGQGRPVAVDAVGPGQGYRTGGGSGYAVERTLLCVRTGLGDSNDDLVPRMGDVLMQSIDRMEQLMLARARPTAESRVSALLCALQQVLGPRGEHRIPSDLLQQDMAALLSMRHESVCRALRALREHGVISRDSDGIRIVDRAQLQQR